MFFLWPAVCGGATLLFRVALIVGWSDEAFGRGGGLGALYAFLYVCKGKGAFVAGALVAIVFLQLYEGL